MGIENYFYYPLKLIYNLGITKIKNEVIMRFEIEIDFIQTYKMIVDTPCETTAEMYGDSIDMEEFDKVREYAGRTGNGYVGFRTQGRNAKLIK
tara:strand:- start:210 stop:488 length:279 start_codon:yes stop_codon:yes gene_type:complete